MTITSSNPGLVLLSNTAAGAGANQITVTIPKNATTSPAFFVQGLADTGGPVSYTATMTNFVSGNGSVALNPSGFVVAGPSGQPEQTTFPTTTQAPNSNITVFSAMLDSSLNYLTQMPLKAGISLTVTSTNTAVGTITTSPISIAAGGSSATTQFHPLTSGSTAVTVTQPSGFSTPAQFAAVTATVITPGIFIDDATIGQNLEVPGNITLGANVPAGGIDVTLTSNNAGLMLLSADGNSAGSASIVIHIASGSSATYFMQALGSSGTVTYTASAPLFGGKTATVTLGSSGAAITGPFGPANPFIFVTAPATAPVRFYMTRIDPNGAFVPQALIPGQSAMICLASSSPGVGTIPAQLTLTGGAASVSGIGTTFQSVAPGFTQITSLFPGDPGVPVGCTMPSFDYSIIYGQVQ
jgi:hypothetical protein